MRIRSVLASAYAVVAASAQTDVDLANLLQPTFESIRKYFLTDEFLSYVTHRRRKLQDEAVSDARESLVDCDRCPGVDAFNTAVDTLLSNQYFPSNANETNEMMDFFCGQRVAMECFSEHADVPGCARGKFDLPGGQEMFKLLDCACEFCPTALDALQDLTSVPYHVVSCKEQFKSAAVCVDQHPACKAAFEKVTGGVSENADELESKDTIKCQCDLCGQQHAAWKDIEVFPAIDV